PVLLPPPLSFDDPPLLGLLLGEPPPLPPLFELLVLLPPPADDGLGAELPDEGGVVFDGLPEKLVLPSELRLDALSASLPIASPRLVPALTAPTTLLASPIKPTARFVY